MSELPVIDLDPNTPAPRRSRNPAVMIRDLRAMVGSVGLYPLMVLLGLSAVERFDASAFGVLGPNIRDSFGMSNASYVAIASLTSVAPLLLAVHLGYYADKANRVRLGALGGLVWGITAILTGLSPAVWMLVIVRLAGGVGQLVNTPVHSSLISDYYPPKALAPAFSVYQLGTGGIGLLAGPLAGLISSFFGWRTAFVVLALPTFVLVAAMAKLREPARGESVGLAVADEERPSVMEGFRRVRAIRSLRRTWWAAAFFGGGVVAFGSILSLYFKDVFELGDTARGAITAVFGLAGLIGIAIGGVLSQRVMQQGKPQLLAVVNGVMVIEFAIGMLLMAIAPTAPTAIVAVFILSIGASGFNPAYTTMVALVAPPKLRAQAFSWSLAWVALGALGVSPIIGAIGDKNGQRVALAVLAGLVGMAGLIEISAQRFVRRDVAEAVKVVDASESDALLVCRGLDVAYEGGVQVLFGVDFEVRAGEVIALLGTNGAGKSTLLRAISGLLDPIGGAIAFDGRDVTHADPVVKTKLGIVQVPGGRGVFPGLTVAENLRIAGWLYRRDAEALAEGLERVFTYFPILRQYRELPAANLSGGQQQMLTLGQALLARPKLLMIDELSLGLAPVIVEQLLQTVRQLAADGTTIILVEQSVNVALTVADTAYFMEKGEIRFHGPTAELLERPDVLRSVFLEGAHTASGGATATRSAAARTRPRVSLATAANGNANGAAPAEPVLELRGLTKRFGGVTANDDVSLILPPHQILGLIGPNGAGKTTLFDMISGFLIPDGGTIALHGHDITHVQPDVRARMGLGRSFQDARLFPALTVSETIALSLEKHVEVRDPLAAALNLPAVSESEAAIDERVEELIEMMGLGAFRDKFVSELSTGSRRIVDLAVIVATDPDVILFDEPSSGIAQRETEALGPLLVRIRDTTGASLLVIEHDMPLITSISDELVAFDLGRVITRGHPNAVVNDPQVVASYLGTTDAVVNRSGAGSARTTRTAAKKAAPAPKKAAPAAKKASARTTKKVAATKATAAKTGRR